MNVINNATVVSRGTRRGKDGHQIKTAQVIYQRSTYHLQYDPRTELWHTSLKRTDSPGPFILPN